MQKPNTHDTMTHDTMTDTYINAANHLLAYDEARANLRSAEQALKEALRTYSDAHNYLRYVSIDTFRAVHMTRNGEAA